MDESTDEIAVWDTNTASFDAFVASASQWRVASTMAGLIWLGLDYSAIDALLRRRGLADETFEDLLVMETAALAALSETEGK